MFNIFRRFRRQQLENGIIADPRPPEVKGKDYQTEEVLKSSPVEWREWSKVNPEIEEALGYYQIFNQDGSSSCLANAVALALGIENYLEEGKFIKLSARDIYTRRKNKPNKGMYFQDAMDIGYKYGATLHNFLLSDGKNEEQMNKRNDYLPSYGEVAKVFKGGNYFWVKKTIEEIAYMLNIEKKPVVMGVKFGPKEWGRQEPKILGSHAPYGHGITALPQGAFNYKGKKTILIQDSWGINSGWNGRRFVSEDWFKANRIIGALAFKKLSNVWRSKEKKEEKPKHTFEKDLVFGMKNEDVVVLQKCLKYLELFPINTESTGFYFNITAKAVYDFQVKYQVASKEELDSLQGKRVGEKTRGKLNMLFS